MRTASSNVRVRGANRKTCAHSEFFAFSPISDVGIAGHGSALVLYKQWISPSRGMRYEQQAHRAATGGYSGGGCRGLVSLDRDRRRRHADATERSSKNAF